MYIDEKKKVLFVIGMEQEGFLKEATHINPENAIILQSYGPVISHPFDDLMRDIILSVYQENVEEIVVVASKDEQKNTKYILNKIYGNKDLREKIQTIDYLFKNCMPEFTEESLSEWLEGSKKSLMDGIHNSVNIIRNHPLMPPHVKVTELCIGQENKKLEAVGVC